MRYLRKQERRINGKIPLTSETYLHLNPLLLKQDVEGFFFRGEKRHLQPINEPVIGNIKSGN